MVERADKDALGNTCWIQIADFTSSLDNPVEYALAGLLDDAARNLAAASYRLEKLESREMPL